MDPKTEELIEKLTELLPRRNIGGHGRNHSEGGSAAGVVMRFNPGFALQNVRPDGSLRQEFHTVQLSGFISEHVDEFFPDDMALLLGIIYTGQLIQEAVHCVHVNQVGIHFIAEDLDNLFRFAFAQQAMVDMYTDKLLPDGFNQQSSYDR